jgi:hypothetical protein
MEPDLILDVLEELLTLDELELEDIDAELPFGFSWSVFMTFTCLL